MEKEDAVRTDIEIRPLSKEQDGENYIRLQREVSPFRRMFDEKDFCDKSWEDMFAEGRVPYAITKGEDRQFCGYCAIKNIKLDKPEIEIELLEKFRGCGIGYAALYFLIDTIAERYGVKQFTYCTDSDNYASQGLVSRVGGKPAGLERFFFLREDEMEGFEEENMDMIDDKLKDVAGLFGVEPRKLLSHILVYTIDIDDFAQSVKTNKGKQNISIKTEEFDLDHAVRRKAEKKYMDNLLGKLYSIHEQDSQDALAEMKGLLKRELQYLNMEGHNG